MESRLATLDNLGLHHPGSFNKTFTVYLRWRMSISGDCIPAGAGRSLFKSRVRIRPTSRA
ncbi:hypothetical protein INR49_027573 [Caranx melampygus]|nr:hypothetical protein INR49_027573 [Caranx melampygus]